MKNHTYLGIKSHVICINTNTGREVWRCKIKRSPLINVAVDGDVVIAHSRGILYGIERSSGKLLWENGLRGLGYGYCMIATEGGSTNQQLQQAIQYSIKTND